MTIDAIAVVGTIGAVASVASFAPQAWKIIRTRNTDGLSAAMYALTCLAFAMWLTFGILQGEWALIVPNALCLILALFILWLVVLPEPKTKAVAEAIVPDD